MSKVISLEQYKRLLCKQLPREIPKSCQGWRKLGHKSYYFRSKWEANYGRYLYFLKKEKQIKDWEHEPKTFWFENIKRGVRSYLPDFKVIQKNGEYYWVEVKGYYDRKSLTKIRRFRKYYPNEKLVLVDKNWFAKNAGVLKPLIKGWE
ncbi:MAG: DUF1064 domain-containing protein [Psychroflexus sp.]